MTPLAESVRSGNPRALARAATLIENRDPDGLALLDELAPFAGHALVVGVTGSPGAGKSTLVDRIASAWKHRGKSVAILAVDPSSPYSGGALLGDRIRMQSHTDGHEVFIRSVATRGALGGLSNAVSGLVMLFDAAGRDVIIIETVGAGQDEVEVARLARITIVVLVPGMGDEVQSIKAGIFEIADVFAINKADLPGVGQLEVALHEFNVPVVQTVATEDKGTAELLDAVASVAPKQKRFATPVTIDHLGIAVGSIEEALGFYQDLLGLPLGSQETVAAEKVHVAMLPVGQARIELLESAAQDSTIAKFLRKRGPGIHHLALRVPDFDAVINRLKASGARFIHAGQRKGAGGHTYVFLHPSSTGGVLVELIKEEH
jgi:LAO/AO transport system kinase